MTLHEYISFHFAMLKSLADMYQSLNVLYRPKFRPQKKFSFPFMWVIQMDQLESNIDSQLNES